MPAPADTVAVRKLHGFAVLGPPPTSVAVQKLHGFVVLHDPAIAPVPAESNLANRRISLPVGIGL